MSPSLHLFIIHLPQLIRLLQTSPARGLELSTWVRAVLVTHTAYLMTVSVCLPEEVVEDTAVYIHTHNSCYRSLT